MSGGVTEMDGGVFPDYTISPYQYYSKRFFDHIEANNPDADMEDIIGADTIEGAKVIIQKEYPFLPGSLPYNVVTNGATYTDVPDPIRHKISFSVKNPDYLNLDISYTAFLPGIAGKRITLSYIPASSSDEMLVTQYGGMLNVPPYLLRVRPVLKIGGTSVATGQSIGLGYEETFSMTFRMPGKNTDSVTNKVTAGDYSAIALQYYSTPVETVGARMKDLHDNVDDQSTDLDDLLGQMLYNIGMSYFHHLAFEEGFYAKNFQMIITREPSEAIATSEAETEWLYGIPYRVTEGGVAFDVDRNVKANFPIDGDRQRAKDFMVVSGIGGSSWEDMALQSFFNIPSVSAAKLLKKAFQDAIPIHTVDNTNVSEIVSQLQVDAEVKTAIRNAVNAGKKVIAPQTNIQYNDWNGAGYIVIDPTTGAGAFMISGGLAGAQVSEIIGIPIIMDRLLDANDPWMRLFILATAGSFIGSPYVFGCKGTYDERQRCRIGGEAAYDCSGLVMYSYWSAGAESMGTPTKPKNAQMQYDSSYHIPDPTYADLIFSQGTYDKDDDCDIEQEDGVTHTGLYIQYSSVNIGHSWVIHANGDLVAVDLIDEGSTRSAEKVIAVKCEEYMYDYTSGVCPGKYSCYSWEKIQGRQYPKLKGFRRAYELQDIC